MLFLTHTPKLNDLDLQIFNYINENMALVPYLPIRTLAKKTHSSTASILRFCHKFECEGYGEFKVRLKLYLANTSHYAPKESHVQEYIAFLKSTQNEAFKDRLTSAVELLKGKDLVLFLGAGTSEAIGGYGALYFSNLSIPALKISDPSNYPSSMFSSIFLKQTVFIVTSVSGETKEVIEYMEHLKAAHATIISICSADRSTIAQLANVNIPYQITRETVQKNFRDPEKETEITTQLPALYILEKLAQSVHSLPDMPT